MQRQNVDQVPKCVCLSRIELQPPKEKINFIKGEIKKMKNSESVNNNNQIKKQKLDEIDLIFNDNLFLINNDVLNDDILSNLLLN